MTKDEMIAIGDGFNDLSMIKYAGLGIAMENAQDIVKENADFIYPLQRRRRSGLCCRKILLGKRITILLYPTETIRSLRNDIKSRTPGCTPGVLLLLYKQRWAHFNISSPQHEKLRLFQKIQLLETFNQLLNSKVNLLFRVSCHQSKTNQSVLRSTSGRNYRIDEYAFIKSQFSNFEGLVCIAHVKRNNRTFCFTDFESGITESLQRIVCNCPTSFSGVPAQS